jgi:hypothetical protein
MALGIVALPCVALVLRWVQNHQPFRRCPAPLSLGSFLFAHFWKKAGECSSPASCLSGQPRTGIKLPARIFEYTSVEVSTSGKVLIPECTKAFPIWCRVDRLSAKGF